jgi:hypothetical protein
LRTELGVGDGFTTNDAAPGAGAVEFALATCASEVLDTAAPWLLTTSFTPTSFLVTPPDLSPSLTAALAAPAAPEGLPTALFAPTLLTNPRRFRIHAGTPPPAAELLTLAAGEASSALLSFVGRGGVAGCCGVGATISFTVLSVTAEFVALLEAATALAATPLLFGLALVRPLFSSDGFFQALRARAGELPARFKLFLAMLKL